MGGMDIWTRVVMCAMANVQNCKFGFVTHLFATEVTKNLQGQLAFGCRCGHNDDELIVSLYAADGSPKGQMCRLTPPFIHARWDPLCVVSPVKAGACILSLSIPSHAEVRTPSAFVQDFQVSLC